jgi:hypothetical protein
MKSDLSESQEQADFTLRSVTKSAPIQVTQMGGTNVR